ncbi:MAG: large subunit ribosomal protein [Thermoleophilaceae bacterium]|nr:large subunit ribosomal protein [Thermoleophilaceae bacterium]
MNRDQKAAVVDRLAGQLESAEAVFAIDYRGLSVKQAVDLRASLKDADAQFQVAKNTLTERAAEKAGAESIRALLEGPTALTFVNGDVAVAAKALATFRRQNGVLEFKGGQLGTDVLTIEQIESLARLPARDVLMQQVVGLTASPIMGVVRGLNALISGLAIQLGAIAEQGLIGGQDAGAQGAEAEAETPAAEAEAPAEAEAEAETPAEEEPAEEEPAAEEPAAEDTSETTETEEG